MQLLTWMTWVEDFQFLRRLPARRSNSLGDTFRPSGSFTIHGRLFSTRMPFRCRLDTGTRAAGADAAPGSGLLHAGESLWEPTEHHASSPASATEQGHPAGRNGAAPVRPLDAFLMQASAPVDAAAVSDALSPLSLDASSLP